MTGMEGFAGRLRKAFRAWEDRLDRDVTETEFGVLVGKEYDGKPVSQASVNRWFKGTLPDHERLIALAKVLGVDPGWLAYGSSGEEGGQGAIVRTNGDPPVIGPTVHRTLPKQVSRLDDPPAKGKRGKRPPKRGDRTAMAG